MLTINQQDKVESRVDGNRDAKDNSSDFSFSCSDKDRDNLDNSNNKDKVPFARSSKKKGKAMFKAKPKPTGHIQHRLVPMIYCELKKLKLC